MAGLLKIMDGEKMYRVLLFVSVILRPICN